MRHAKKLIVGTIAAVAVLAAAVAVINLQPEPVAATNQGKPPAPTGVTVTNTADGVLVSWNDDQADVHRIAWAHITEMRVATNAGDFDEAVHFADTKRDTDYTIKHLPEGQQYYIRVGAAHSRESGAAWDHPWQLITIGATGGGTPVAIPDQPCTTTPDDTTTPEGTPSPTSTPTVPLPTSTPAPPSTNNRPPAFSGTTGRMVPENSTGSTSVGTPVTADDPDGDTLTYHLSGNDAVGFAIGLETGQIATKNGVTYDHESKSEYLLTVSANDNRGGTASVDITVYITDVNEAPSFEAGFTTTRQVPENSPANTNVGMPVSASDPERDILTYSLSGADAAYFAVITDGQIATIPGATYDYETKSSYSMVLTASDGKLSGSITVTVNLTDVSETTTIVVDPAPEPPQYQQQQAANNPPTFDGTTTTREVPENSGSGTNVGGAVTATDPDDDTLTYTLSGTDRIRFAVNGSTGQITTVANETYDYELKSSYLVHVLAADGNGGTDIMKVTINLTNVNEGQLFADGNSASREMPTGSAAGTNAGDPITAKDLDGDTLTYTKSGTDAASFDIDSSNGQITAKEGVTYDRATKASYSVTVQVSDGKGETASIGVTINLTEATANAEETTDESTSVTREVAENSDAGTNVGAPVTATASDGESLSHSLWGTDASSFSINSATGQITTISGVTYDYETKSSYSVEVDISNGDGFKETIGVTINLTDVEEPTAVTACSTNLGTLTATAWYDGLVNDAGCKAHHQDTSARYFHFTVPEQKSVSISAGSWGELYVSKGTPNKGWGTAPNGTYEQRREVRRTNGKLLHDSGHVATPENDGQNITLSLNAGEAYTVEVAATSGYFNVRITP